jgi:hypothetical protein
MLSRLAHSDCFTVSLDLTLACRSEMKMRSSYQLSFNCLSHGAWPTSRCGVHLERQQYNLFVQARVSASHLDKDAEFLRLYLKVEETVFGSSQA